MNKIKNIIIEMRSHKSIYFFFILFFCVGIFLRLYHFSSLMHFELDQARDVFVMYDIAEEGIEKLPLLGPQARGRELYLGPIFYYFQYGSSVLFGVSPESAALPDVLFSILAIPLFYFFARLFFNRTISVSLMALVATSLFFIIYARFAWNPNAMFLWSLVTFYGLLRSYRSHIFNAKWFMVGVIGLAIVMQLHFIAFIAAPLTFILYMIIVRMHVPWRTWGATFLVFSFLFLPVIISDIKNDGQNIRAFFSSVTMNAEEDAESNTAADKEHDIIEKMFRAGQESGTFYWHIISGDDHGGYNVRTKKQERGYFPLICDAKCHKTLSYHLFAMLFITLSIAVFLWRSIASYKKYSIEIDEYNARVRWNDHVLIGLWLFFGALFLTMVAYQISPRFYLFLAAPFFIILGSVLDVVYKFRKVGKFFSVGIIVVLVVCNLYFTRKYFILLTSAVDTTSRIEWRDLSMNRSDLVTLGQLRIAGNYIDDQDDDEAFVVVGDNRYARALYYITAIENDHKEALCYMKRGGFVPERLEGKMYYLLVREASEDHIDDNMKKFHTIVNKKNIGTITLYKLKPKNENIMVNDVLEGCFVR